MDIELNYVEKGSGEVLILLHGNGQNYLYFRHQIDYFARQYHVIAIDTRGHGNSPRGIAPFTIVQFSEDLHDFMLLHGIEKAYILGFSDGGNIALYFALRYPQYIRKLILNGATINPQGVKRILQLSIDVGYWIAVRAAKKSTRALKYAERLGLMANEPNIKPEELKNINMPVLVIAGTYDIIKHSHTELIASSIPMAKLVFIKGNHYIALKNSCEFNHAVEEFLWKDR